MVPNKTEQLLSQAIDMLNETAWNAAEGDIVKMDAYYYETLKLINEARKENAKNPITMFHSFIARFTGKS